jgi:hypothetical protein
MSIESKYMGRCRRCGMVIRPGDLIDKDRRHGWVHALCLRPSTIPVNPVENWFTQEVVEDDDDDDHVISGRDMAAGERGRDNLSWRD